VVTHQLQVELRTAKAHQPKTNALPLDYATKHRRTVALDEEIISGGSLAGFKRKLDRRLGDKRGYIYISFSFLPLYRQLDDWIH